MAEVKAHDYQFDFEPEYEKQPEPVQTPPVRPDIIKIPASPARRLKKVSRMEKFLAVFLLFAIIGLAVLTIYVRTDISQLEHEVSQIEAETAQNAVEKTRLEQEKSELSKAERIKEVAEKKGLTNKNNDNLRKVTDK